MRIPYEDVKLHIPPNVGQQVRINHDHCTAGRDTKQRLYIQRNRDAVVAYCHNCGGHVFRRGKMYPRSHDALAALLNEHEKKEATAQTVVLPTDIQYDTAWWPAEAKAWLYKYNMTDKEIDHYRIGYSPSWGRVILPVYNSDGLLIFWQGRSIDGADPKYVSVKGAAKPVFKTADDCDGRPNIDCFITEDMLSAIAVNRTWRHMTGIAALGTTLDVNELTKYSTVSVWLDPDEAGRTKQLELVSRLKLLVPDRVWTMIGCKEPKHYSTTEIESYGSHPNYRRV